MVRTRRLAPHRRGARVHLRATMRESLRDGGDIIPLVRARTMHTAGRDDRPEPYP
jgi:uncharacterized protein with von Willebrand factor type A (vWA) domain